MQDADCVCVCVCNMNAPFDIYGHFVHLREGKAGVLALYEHQHGTKCVDFTEHAFQCCYVCVHVSVGVSEWVPEHPAGRVQVSGEVCLVTAAAHD